MTHCVVEFFGQARELARAKEIEVELPEGSSLRDLLAALGGGFPQLKGKVLSPDGAGLLPHYALSLNGRFFPEDLGFKLQEGDHVLLMFAAAGG